MGGKNGLIRKVGGAYLNDVTKALTLGTVDLQNKQFTLNPETASQNLLDGATGKSTTNAMFGGDASLPQAEDPEIQARKARAEAESVVDKQVNAKNGLASTMLGGSISPDGSNLRKKKLLGE